MGTTGTALRKRRSIEPDAKPHLIRVQIDESLRVRLTELSDRHGVAVGTIAREAMTAGMRAVTERLRRVSRGARQDTTRDARPEADA